MDNGASSYRRFLDGDDTGIVEIIKDYKDGLMLFINRYVKNIHIAEELTEDTFFKLVTKKPRFVAKYSFKTWLYTIGRNVALNYIKHNSNIAVTSIEEIKDLCADEHSVEYSYLREEQKVQLNHALSQINSDYATVLHLKYFEDMDNEQISKVLNKSKRQVENMIYQAKQVLKAELIKEGFVYERL